MDVGDYVRYRCAYDNTIKIKKINAIVPPDNLIKENYYKFDYYEGTIEKCIVKSSPNIIDLIEVGDYVNKKYLDEDELKWYRKYPEYIKYVATKEQMEAMEYKVGE